MQLVLTRHHLFDAIENFPAKRRQTLVDNGWGNENMNHKRHWWVYFMYDYSVISTELTPFSWTHIVVFCIKFH